MKKNNVETTVQDNKVTYKRHVAVPIELAFEAWSSHDHLSKWWGPDGFTITTKTLNFSTGGVWDFIMHGPDGRNYKNKIQYMEIRKPHYISYKHLGDGEGGGDVRFYSNIFFEAVGDGTHVTMEQIFPSKAELERVNKEYGAIEGGIQHTNHMAKYLESLK